MSAGIRRLAAADLDAVMQVQAACYPPALNETRAVFARRLAAAPDTAWLAETAGGVGAYLFCYRSQPGGITPLGGDFAPSREGTALYIHDLAVAPAASGQGLARRLLETAWASARANGLAFCTLVAVPEAIAFWTRLGFVPAQAADQRQQANLASYGTQVAYLQRAL
ncbi:N-acetyltransferase [Dechloromonas sp. ZY10]|uniref:GNAT family N-acetyltransferase n=1 Tax=Dechloromonas aquae TaxID=2664436 RepID=UPI00352741C3